MGCRGTDVCLGSCRCLFGVDVRVWVVVVRMLPKHGKRKTFVLRSLDVVVLLILSLLGKNSVRSELG